jgi:hypothetical protein
MNDQIKKVTVLLLATSLVFAAAAMLIPKKAVAAFAAQVFLANHSVPVSNPMPTRDVGSQTIVAFDQVVTVTPGAPAIIGPVDVSMFKQIRVSQIREGGFPDYTAFSFLVNPNNANDIIPLDDLNKGQFGRGTQTDEVLSQIQVEVVGGLSGTSTVRVQIYGRSN